jgi:coniferyl-aldehyde dehydrogenase
MNDRLLAPLRTDTGVADIHAAQQQAFARQPYPSASERRHQLRALKRQLHRYQDLLAEAMSQDFGFRSPAESKMLDILGSTLEINHAISHVGGWMKPSRRSAELLFATNSVRVTYQPKGVVGIIVPWNFPLYLALGPLAAALAAGNRAMIKMPEVTPATNAVLRRMLAEVFPPIGWRWSARNWPTRTPSRRCPSTTSSSPARRRSAASSCAPRPRT